MTSADTYYGLTAAPEAGGSFYFYCDTDTKIFRGSGSEAGSSAGNDAYFPLPANNAVNIYLAPGETIFFSCASAGKKIRTMYGVPIPC